VAVEYRWAESHPTQVMRCKSVYTTKPRGDVGTMRTIARWFYRSLLCVLLVTIMVPVCLRLAALQRESGGAVAPAGGQMVSTPDSDIFIQARGPADGPSVLLVHGTAAWSGFWLGVADELGHAGFRSIAIDLPPFGFSRRSATAAYSRADQAERLDAVIGALGLTPAIVVGHSFGAGAVVELAMQHPEALRGMILVDGALGLTYDEPAASSDFSLMRALLGQQAVTQILVSGVMTNPWLTRPLLASLLFRKEAADEMQVAILAAPFSREGTTEAYARWLPFLLLPERNAASAKIGNYARLAMPVALIWGGRDSVTPIAQAQRLNGLISGSTLDVLDGVGHIPHIENKEAFLAALKARLAEMAAH
jgi:pimeloyl-ACP methyl ester carboxylesterase